MHAYIQETLYLSSYELGLIEFINLLHPQITIINLKLNSLHIIQQIQVEKRERTNSIRVVGRVRS